MSAYNKLFAAIVSTLISRWMLQYLGIDAESLGVAPDLQMLVALLIDGGVAGFNGFWVWLLPNEKPAKPDPMDGIQDAL